MVIKLLLRLFQPAGEHNVNLLNESIHLVSLLCVMCNGRDGRGHKHNDIKSVFFWTC